MRPRQRAGDKPLTQSQAQHNRTPRCTAMHGARVTEEHNMTTRSIARTTTKMQGNFVPPTTPRRRTNAEREWAHGYDACSNGRPYCAMHTPAMRRGWLAAQADGCWQTYRDEYARLMGA